MTDESPDPLQTELQLTERQILTCRAHQARMLELDADATGKDRSRLQKRDHLYTFVDGYLDAVASESTSGWVPRELLDARGRSVTTRLDTLVSLAPTLSAEIDERRIALIILAELMTFAPWNDGNSWQKNARSKALEIAARDFSALRDDDLASMSAQLDDLLKALRRQSIRWGRIAAVAAAGAGLGVLTGGLAAPAIGAAVGSSMGLSGAAATSAGLAALGGGSLASGGFGVAGGTFLIYGVGGVTFAGAAAAGSRFTPLVANALVTEAVKLDLIARMVLADAPDCDEKIRRVVESLQERINRLNDRTLILIAKIDSLRKEKADSESENANLKEEIQALRSEVERMRSARATLTVVRNRLPEGATS
ncbi:DUF726 domain-containing protein [Tsukamurella sp. NPDC003166]|uniref:DUF726 domain-containing protein n=1 Tax=Tsukamurella sp. NPDC003166 TaxID=3154444 RepID=UPI00339F0DB1